MTTHTFYRFPFLVCFCRIFSVVSVGAAFVLFPFTKAAMGIFYILFEVIQIKFSVVQTAYERQIALIFVTSAVTRSLEGLRFSFDTIFKNIFNVNGNCIIFCWIRSSGSAFVIWSCATGCSCFGLDCVIFLAREGCSISSKVSTDFLLPL